MLSDGIREWVLVLTLSAWGSWRDTITPLVMNHRLRLRHIASY